MEQLTEKFWNFWKDPIIILDGAAYTFLVIQVNLAAGTIAPFAHERTELATLLDDILAFRVS